MIKVAEILNTNVDDMYGIIKFTPSTADAPIKSIPILGEIAAGNPIMSEQYATEYINVASYKHIDFGFVVEGDSMIGDNIQNGDYVFIRKQPVVENGEICAVLIETDITLKHFKRIDEKQVMFVSSNPAYDPIVCKESDCTYVQVIGKLVQLERFFLVSMTALYTLINT